MINPRLTNSSVMFEKGIVNIHAGSLNLNYVLHRAAFFGGKVLATALILG